MVQKAQSGSKLANCMKAPIRILAKARDFYVNRLSEFSGHPSTRYIAYLPRSASVDSSNIDEDLRELICAASQTDLRGKHEGETKQHRQPSSNRLPRSFTVGVQRIDEDEVWEFDELPKLMTIDGLNPRSRSGRAVSARRTDLHHA